MQPECVIIAPSLVENDNEKGGESSQISNNLRAVI